MLAYEINEDHSPSNSLRVITPLLDDTSAQLCREYTRKATHPPCNQPIQHYLHTILHMVTVR